MLGRGVFDGGGSLDGRHRTILSAPQAASAVTVRVPA